jgi:hypothetical protein
MANFLIGMCGVLVISFSHTMNASADNNDSNQDDRRTIAFVINAIGAVAAAGFVTCQKNAFERVIVTLNVLNCAVSGTAEIAPVSSVTNTLLIMSNFCALVATAASESNLGYLTAVHGFNVIWKSFMPHKQQ